MDPAFSDTHTLSHAPQPLHIRAAVAHLDRLVRAGVEAVAATRLAECEALVLVDHGLAHDGVLGRGAFGEHKRLGGAIKHAQRHAAVFLGAEIAVIHVEVECRRAHAK